VTVHPTAEWIAQQVTEAFPWTEAQRYLFHDRDGIYGAAVRRRLRAMGIRDKPIAPGSPWQNGHVERLIETIRRKCLDHMIVFGEAHLRRMLEEYVAYYNKSRIHRTSPRGSSSESHHDLSSVAFIQYCPRNFSAGSRLRTELHAALNSCFIASAMAKTFIPSFASYVPDLPLSFGKSDLPA
jgi:hypothetical protein